MFATLLMITLTTGTFAGLIGAAWGMSVYNRLIARRNAIDNAFATIDVISKKRYDLVPNLVACVKGYVAHEKAVLEEIVALRSRAETPGLPEADRMVASNAMTAMLMGFMGLTENYPRLQADSQFLHLQRSLVELEEQLSAARRFFNTAVTRYNTTLQSMPTVLIAGRLGFDGREWFQALPAERVVPVVSMSSLPTDNPDLTAEGV